MHRNIYLILLLILHLNVGCNAPTTSINLKAKAFYDIHLTKEIPVAIDAQSQIAINKRHYFLEIEKILEEIGINVVSAKEAEHLLVIQFKENESYSAKDNLFYRHEGNWEDPGIIVLSLIKIEGNNFDIDKEKVWEGLVEVEDIKKRYLIKRSLQFLMKYFLETKQQKYIIL